MSQQSISAATLATEAVERDLTPDQIDELRPFAQLIHWMRSVAVVDENAAFEIAANVIDKIAVAESIEAVFAANDEGPAGADEYLDTPIGVYEAKFWRSAEKFRSGTLGYYVAVSVVDANGKDAMITVGASNVVASMARFVQLGGINGDPATPLWLKIHGRETPNGTLLIVQGATPPPF